MLSILEIAAARSDPRAKADGSLKLPPSVAAPPGAAGAGDGVDGIFDDEVLWAATGAGGGAGVCAGPGVGVEGAFTEGDAAEELPGATFGWFKFSKLIRNLVQRRHTFETIHTMNPFSSILYDSTVLASCNILPVL